MMALQWRAYLGETDCGDQLGYWQDGCLATGGRLTCCVVDGLGHGSHAKVSACKMIQFVANHRSESLETLLTQCDQAMHNDRGGVMAVAHIEGNQLSYASVGNISGYWAHVDVEQGTHQLEPLAMSRGMISGGFKKLHVQTMTLTAGDCLIMHSDGLNPFCNLNPWHSVLNDSEKLATVLLEDQSKGSDDASVLVYRHEELRGAI